MEPARRGKRGLVLLQRRGPMTVAVKVRNPRSRAPNTLPHEARILRLVNAKGLGPALVEADEDKLVMEYIMGIPLGDFLESASRQELLAVLRGILRQCRLLDEMGVSKQELTNPYKDILVREGGPVLLDFERARLTSKPKNVTQFCQYLSSKKIRPILERSGLALPVAKLREDTRAYKAAPSEKAFRAIEALLKPAQSLKSRLH